MWEFLGMMRTLLPNSDWCAGLWLSATDLQWFESLIMAHWLSNATLCICTPLSKCTLRAGV
jgi:hypothetical protein